MDRGSVNRLVLPGGFVVLCAAFAVALVVCAAGLLEAAFPSANWVQVNQDGFVSGATKTSAGSKLFVFDARLYAFNEFGLYRMDDPATRTWTQVALPAQPGGPGTAPKRFKTIGNALYAWDASQLWWIGPGLDLTGANWTPVASTGPTGGASPIPHVLFGGKIYGVFNPTVTGPFEIWRTSDLPGAAATWERVVQNSFGDPANNHDVDLMIVFNARLYATTDTLNGVFGNPYDYGTGVEVWESASGDAGTWSQVNADGFGTMLFTPPCYSPTLCTFALHQMLGSATVYQPSGAPQAYLYLGTKSHYGAEVWRYDGSGLSGWTNVTPLWAGPCTSAFCADFGGPGRNDAMEVFAGNLWLGEGFPTGNVAVYDGTNWQVEVAGPNPFDPDNGGTASLATFQARLHAGTLHAFGGNEPDQVWRYTFSPADVRGTKSVSSAFGSAFLIGGGVTYTVVLTNTSAFPQLDNPGDEFNDTLPSQLTLTGASATTGTIGTGGNTVHWNGTIPANGSVTIVIDAVIAAGNEGATVVNQGVILCDADGDGINESARLTDAPGGAGATDPTSFQVFRPIRTASPLGLALLALALAAAGVLAVRRA